MSVYSSILMGLQVCTWVGAQSYTPMYTFQTIQEIIHTPYFLSAHTFKLFSSFAPDFLAKVKYYA